MTDGAGTVSYGYDNLDRLTGVTRGSDTFSYAYDAAGNVTSRTFPGSLTTSYTYDNEERLASATTGAATTSYSYDPDGNLTQTTLPSSNGYVETRSYDDAGRLVDVKNANSTGTLSEFSQTLDPVGNPTEIDRTGAVSSVTTYGYDANDRLTSVCDQASCPNPSDPKTTWTYDQVGNRLTQTDTSGTTNYSYNADDELTAAGSTSYSYDADGNELTAGTNTYTYDLAGQMTSADDGTTTTDYSYDGDGNRVEATSGASPSDTTHYLWDTNAADGMPELAIERDGSGTTLRSYSYGLNRISMATGGSSFYYHYDTLGSVANVTSSTGSSEWTYAYDPFGNAAATQNDPSAPDNPMQYDGQCVDPTGLYYLRAREYDATSGRMLSRDPLEETPDGIVSGEYEYAGDGPTTMADPTGEFLSNFDLGGDGAVSLVGVVTSPAISSGAGDDAAGAGAGSPTGSDSTGSAISGTLAANGSSIAPSSLANGCLICDLIPEIGVGLEIPGLDVVVAIVVAGAVTYECIEHCIVHAATSDEIVDQVLEGAEPERLGKHRTDIYVKPHGDVDEDFEELTGERRVPDQRSTTANLRGNGGKATSYDESGDGRPTIRIDRPGKRIIKIRYPREV